MSEEVTYLELYSEYLKIQDRMVRAAKSELLEFPELMYAIEQDLLQTRRIISMIADELIKQ